MEASLISVTFHSRPSSLKGTLEYNGMPTNWSLHWLVGRGGWNGGREEEEEMFPRELGLIPPIKSFSHPPRSSLNLLHFKWILIWTAIDKEEYLTRCLLRGIIWNVTNVETFKDLEEEKLNKVQLLTKLERSVYWSLSAKARQWSRIEDLFKCWTYRGEEGGRIY